MRVSNPAPRRDADVCETRWSVLGIVPCESRRRACGIPVTSAIDQYIDEIWLEKGLSDNTLSAYRRDLQALAADVGKDLLEVSEPDLLQVLAKRYRSGYNASSSARWLSCIKGFYRHNLARGRIVRDPATHIEHPKLGRRLPDSLVRS